MDSLRRSAPEVGLSVIRHVTQRECLRAHVVRALLLTLSLCLAVRGAYAQPAALYKDGNKVLDFGNASAPTLSSTTASNVAQAPGAAFLNRVFGDRSRVTSARPEYVRLVAESRRLVDVLRAGPRSSGDGGADFAHLLELAEPIRAAHEAGIDEVAKLGASGLGAAKLARLTRVAAKYRDHGTKLLDLMDRLADANRTGNAAAVRDLLGELDRFLPAAGTEIARPPPPRASPTMIPMESRPPALLDPRAAREAPASSYRTKPSSADGFSPADLTETIDVKFTPDINALAAQLGHSPAKIYEYVRNHVAFECYLGSRKGSQQTFQNQKGNDYDQASLLIALLRTSGIPAHYASARVRITGDQLERWLGFPYRYTGGVMLNTAGFAVTLYGTISSITAANLNRVWVEAWVPYTNYRGAVHDSTEMRWVPLDPVFKDHTTNVPLNVYSELGLNSEQFISTFYSTVRLESPVQSLEQVMLATLVANHTGALYDDMIQTRAVVPELDGILPGTLPSQLLSAVSTFSSLAPSQRYSVRFHVYGSALLDYTTSTPELSSKQVTLSYVGATPADQSMIDAAGGIWFLTTPYLVDLVPILKVDGCEVAHGTGAITAGYFHSFDMEFTPPTGAPVQQTLVQNSILAGAYDGLGIDTEDAAPGLVSGPVTSCGEEYLGQVMHQAAVTYLGNVDAAQDSLAGLMHLQLTNDVSEAIVENQINVWTDFFGNPVELQWVGMLVDADRKIIGTYSIHGTDLTCDFFRIGGADGSFQEHHLFESVFGEEAISTMKILALANDMSIGTCKITTSIAADCPGMSQYPEVVSAINSYLAAGYVVYAPKAPLTYFEWTGTAWIAMDPTSCAAGYIIYGGHSSALKSGGGATVKTWTVSYAGLQCLNPSGTITVAPAGDVYCGTNTAHWTFTVHGLQYIGKNSGGTPCQLLQTVDKDFVVDNHTIKQLADDPTFGPGEYTFKVGGGACPACVAKEKKVTIIKLVSEAVATIPADRKRSKLGIGEDVKMTLQPTSLSGVTWSKTGNGTLSAASGNPITFTAHDQVGATTVTATYMGAACDLPFSVVEPTGETAVKISSDAIPAGTQGAGMMIRIFISPTDVSFSNIEARELPGPASNITG